MRGPNARSAWRLLPNAFTLARPVLGAASGVAVFADQAASGAWLYLLGYLTDVVDGWLARRLGVASARGRQLDGWADTAFHALVGLGLAGRAAREQEWWVVAVLFVLVVGGKALQWWVVPYTLVGKAIAGGYRIVVFSLFLPFVPASSRSTLIATGLVVMLVTYAYEGRVTLAELRGGQRTIR